MTTQAEVKKWVRPLIEMHPTMVQEKRLLLVRPVDRILRAVMFMGGRSRLNPNPFWMLRPLCLPRGLLRSFGDQIPVGHTDWPGFDAIFHPRINAAILNYLLPTRDLVAFYELRHDPAVFHRGDLISRFPAQHAVILAAMGRFNEAEAVLASPLAKLEASATAELERGRQLVAKRSNSGVGKLSIEYGARDLVLAGELGQLLAALTQRDTAAVAALLHRWEQQNVTDWGVGAHWQPTPFPFESA